MTLNQQLHKEVITAWEHKLSLCRTGRYDEALFGQLGCAFCQEYIDKYCQGCPIYKESGKTNCLNTPYSSVLYRLIGAQNALYFTELTKAHFIRHPRLIGAIERELHYLKALPNIWDEK